MRRNRRDTTLPGAHIADKDALFYENTLDARRSPFIPRYLLCNTKYTPRERKSTFAVARDIGRTSILCARTYAETHVFRRVPFRPDRPFSQSAGSSEYIRRVLAVIFSLSLARESKRLHGDVLVLEQKFVPRSCDAATPGRDSYEVCVTGGIGSLRYKKSHELFPKSASPLTRGHGRYVFRVSGVCFSRAHFRAVSRPLPVLFLSAYDKVRPVGRTVSAVNSRHNGTSSRTSSLARAWQSVLESLSPDMYSWKL